MIATRETSFLSTEHVSRGALFDYLEDHRRMTEKEARAMFWQPVAAVQYCHRRGIIHSHLKPENILLDAKLNVKLADFGPSSDFTGHKLRVFCATPELSLYQTCDAPGVDIERAWGYFCAPTEMVTRTLQFVDTEAADTEWALPHPMCHIYGMSKTCF